MNALTAFLECLATFFAVCVLSVFAAKKWKVPAGAAPFAVLCGTVLWYSAMACINQLMPAGILWFGMVIAALCWLWLRRRQLNFRALVTPATVFFVVAGVAVIALLAVRQPVFTQWDEFSFWGLAPKVVKSTGQLYTYNPGEMRVTTYVPGLIMLDEAFQFLGTQFVQWKVFAAYDILMFAVFAAGLSVLERKHWHIAVPTAAVMCLLPFLMTMYFREINMVTVYISAYADLPMGLLFGAPLALYFSREEKTPAILWTCVMGVAFVSITKDTGFALALVAAAILCFDLIFVQAKNSVRLTGRVGGLAAKWTYSACLMLAPLATYFGWAQHMAMTLGVSRSNLGGDRNMSPVQLLATGLGELFGINRTERFSRVMGEMWQAFYSTKLTMFNVGSQQGGVGRIVNGSGAVVVALILAILLGAFLLEKGRRRRGIAWFSLWSTLGFAAYYIFIGFTYVYVFSEAAEMTDYNRYIYPYYTGWLLAALAIFAAALRRAKPGALMHWALLALTAVCAWRVATFVPAELTVLNDLTGALSERTKNTESVEQAKALLTEEDRVFYIAMPDNGISWFVDSFDFYPEVHVDYSFGGGNWMDTTLTRSIDLPANFTDEQVEYFLSHPLTPETVCEYIDQTGCTAIFIRKLDGAFKEQYGHLFSDGLEGDWQLYRIVKDESGMTFVPVPEGGKIV